MAGTVIAAFPNAYRYGMSEDEAVDFALQELDYQFATVTDPSDTPAFIIEPVQGDGGYLPVPDRFLQGLEERAREHNILLIVDETQAGVGRTGKFCAHQHSGVSPDVIITAKGLASGFPISAIAASTQLMSKALPGSQGGTYGGNAVSAAAAVETFSVIEDEGLVDNAAARGKQLHTGLRSLQEKYGLVGDVRGREPDPYTARRVQQHAVDQRLLLLTCGPLGNVIRVVPALTVSSDEINLALNAFDKTLDAIVVQ